MGAPELPDPGDEDLRPPADPIISDGSDNESVEGYLGYQPLAVDDIEESRTDFSTVQCSSTEQTENVTLPNLEPIERAETEIIRQLWANNALPNENRIELDTTRTAQILSAMANFTLPNATIPAWAMDVPEEHWKEELLQRIRQRKETQGNENTKTRKQ